MENQENQLRQGPRLLFVTKYKEGKRFTTNLAFDGETQTFTWTSEVATNVRRSMVTISLVIE